MSLVTESEAVVTCLSRYAVLGFFIATWDPCLYVSGYGSCYVMFRECVRCAAHRVSCMCPVWFAPHKEAIGIDTSLLSSFCMSTHAEPVWAHGPPHTHMPSDSVLASFRTPVPPGFLLSPCTCRPGRSLHAWYSHMSCAGMHCLSEPMLAGACHKHAWSA